MPKPNYDLAVLLFITFFLIMLMALFILFIIYLHRKKQLTYQEKIDEIEANYERNLLQTQLEIQEQTFQNISREIHDNISLSLTLAKLHLNTLDWKDPQHSAAKVETSVGLLTQSIAELSDISKGLNADIIIQHGLLKALEEEMDRIRQTGLFELVFTLNGTPVYMDNQKELIIFRIIQESFNNIIKHANATQAGLALYYNTDKLVITVTDDGNGFDTTLPGNSRHAGLKNMETRTKLLQGTMEVSSQPGNGTTLSFTIPF